MAKSKKSGCTNVTFHTKSGKPVRVTRCKGRKLTSSAKRAYARRKAEGNVCRAGGSRWREAKGNLVRTRTGKRLAPHMFVKCD